MKIHAAALAFPWLVTLASASVVGSRDAVPLSKDATFLSNGDKTFSLTQIRNDRFKSPDVPTRLISAYAKYGNGDLPPDLKEAIQTNPDLNRKFSALVQKGGFTKGSTPAFPLPMFDSEYLVPVKIGTPPQIIPLNLDTGSSDFWTISTDTYSPQIKGHQVYHPEASNTSQRIHGQGWIVRYGDGANAAGIVYKDLVQVGDTSFDSQAIQSAVQISPSLSNDEFSSGILGMAWSGANTIRPDPQLTYFDNIKNQLEKPLFTANLQRGRPGNYNFGYINQSEFNGPIQYAQSNPDSNFWEISVGGYQIGKSGKYQPWVWNSIVDTGTTLLLAPPPIVEDYYSQVEGAVFDSPTGSFVFPCDTTLPDFIFGLGPYRGVIPGHYINYSASSSTKCYGGIQNTHGTSFGVLGDVLLKAQFVVFDAENRVVGFANKPTDPPPE